jgi:hypothetical protein
MAQPEQFGHIDMTAARRASTALENWSVSAVKSEHSTIGE